MWERPILSNISSFVNDCKITASQISSCDKSQIYIIINTGKIVRTCYNHIFVFARTSYWFKKRWSSKSGVNNNSINTWWSYEVQWWLLEVEWTLRCCHISRLLRTLQKLVNFNDFWCKSWIQFSWTVYFLRGDWRINCVRPVLELNKSKAIQ